MMITSDAVSWQQELVQAITDPAELLQLLELSPEHLPGAINADRDFRLKVPRTFVAKMRRGDLSDPLLQQVLPLGIELQSVAAFGSDPLGERSVNPIPGLLHKYQSRVLLIVTGTCGVNCRYCFRRHFPYADNQPGQQHWDQALAYIAADPLITEVILSGGDPLVAPDRLLAALVARIATIPHVRSLRIHSRLPVLIPSRINAAFMEWFCSSRLKPILVTHVNHPQELDSAFIGAMHALQARGVTLLNQSVLLRGINNTVETLKLLSERLFFDAAISPYYLHMLDKVQGAAHFDVNLLEAQTLMHALRAVLPGYLVPRLAQEVAGASSKTIVG